MPDLHGCRKCLIGSHRPGKRRVSLLFRKSDVSPNLRRAGPGASVERVAVAAHRTVWARELPVVGGEQRLRHAYALLTAAARPGYREHADRPLRRSEREVSSPSPTLHLRCGAGRHLPSGNMGGCQVVFPSGNLPNTVCGFRPPHLPFPRESMPQLPPSPPDQRNGRAQA